MLSAKHISLVVLLLLVTTVVVRAQEPESEVNNNSFGVLAGVGLNQQSGNFSQLPGIPNCGSIFTNGFGIGPNFGLFYKRILSSSLSLSVRALYQSEGGTFNADEQFPLSVDGNGVLATDRHSLEVTMSSVALQPVIGYSLFPKFSLFAGPQISYLLSGSFSQVETLTDPVGGIFKENNLRTRNAQSGELPNPSKIKLALVVGASYELPLNIKNSLALIPQAQFNIGLSPVLSDLTWTTTMFAIAMGLQYTPQYEPPIPEPTPPPPPPPPVEKKPRLIASITAMGVEQDTIEKPIAVIRIEEISESRLSPIVPYIFFDENSATIPSRYAHLNQEERKNFSMKNLYGLDPLSMYTHTLDIIGSRMTEHPEAKITITGCNAHNGKELDNKTLSESRARVVEDYLANTWGITQKRIIIKSRDLPENPAPIKDSDGIVENRRAEISSTNADIIAPIRTSDTIRKATPPVIRFHPTVTSDAGIAGWKLVVSDQGKTLRTFGANSDIPTSINWNLDGELASLYPQSVEYTLTVVDNNNQLVTAQGTLPFNEEKILKTKNEQQGGYAIEKYNLLLFDFNSSEISGSNKSICTFIRSRVTPKTKVLITGYTDRIGDAELNKKLSFDRANNAAKNLGISNAIINGKGNTEIIFNNDLPEGRVFSRTVEIELQIPLDELKQP